MPNTKPIPDGRPGVIPYPIVADGARAVSLHPYVDAVAAQTTAAGARLKPPVENEFHGHQFGTIAGPFGHIRDVSSHVEDVSPEEINRSAAALRGAES